MVAIVALIVFVERAQRRIPVQYAKRVVGRRVYGGQNTLPAARASTRAASSRSSSRSRSSSCRATSRSCSGADWMKQVGELARRMGQPLYVLLLRARASSSSATSTRRSSSTRPTPPTTCASTAASSRASGPGKKTADYIDTVLSRLTIIGAVVPDLRRAAAGVPVDSGFKVQAIPWIGPCARRDAPAVLDARASASTSTSAARRS